jgi:hypothetical protein
VPADGIQLRARSALEAMGFVVDRVGRGYVVRATKGPRRIYGPDMVSVLETAKANYMIPKEAK